MKNRKYPLNLFFMCTALELFKTWYILVFAFVFSLLRLIVPSIPITIPLLFLTAWFVLAILKQLVYRAIILNKDPTDDLLNKMFQDNGKGHRNIIDAINEILEKQEDSSDL